MAELVRLASMLFGGNSSRDQWSYIVFWIVQVVFRCCSSFCWVVSLCYVTCGLPHLLMNVQIGFLPAVTPSPPKKTMKKQGVDMVFIYKKCHFFLSGFIVQSLMMFPKWAQQLSPPHQKSVFRVFGLKIWSRLLIQEQCILLSDNEAFLEKS